MLELIRDRSPKRRVIARFNHTVCNAVQTKATGGHREHRESTIGIERNQSGGQ
jgi:hypothetical protein